MLPARIAAFGQKLSDGLRESFGVAVTFRGQPYTWARSAQDESLELGMGGHREGGAWKLRVPASITPAPGYDAQGKRIQEFFLVDGRKYHITACKAAPANSPLAKDHIVEAVLA